MAVEKALIRNIAPDAVGSEHIASTVAGSGLGGGGGSPLNVKCDNKSVEISNDSLQIKEGGVGAEHISDGAITQDKLDETLSQIVVNIQDGIYKTLYKVGDYFISERDENPAERFGGEWKKIEGKLLMASGEANITMSDSVKFIVPWSASAEWHGSTSSRIIVQNRSTDAYIDWHSNDDAGWYSYSRLYASAAFLKGANEKATLTGSLKLNALNSSNLSSLKFKIVLASSNSYNPDGIVLAPESELIAGGILSFSKEIDLSEVAETAYIVASCTNQENITNSLGYETIVAATLQAQASETTAVTVEAGQEGVAAMPYVGVNIWRKISDTDAGEDEDGDGEEEEES